MRFNSRWSIDTLHKNFSKFLRPKIIPCKLWNHPPIISAHTISESRLHCYAILSSRNINLINHFDIIKRVYIFLRRTQLLKLTKRSQLQDSRYKGAIVPHKNEISKAVLPSLLKQMLFHPCRKKKILTFLELY